MTTAPAPTPLGAAKPPVGTGAAPAVGLLVALALVAVGAVGVQEALVRSGVLSQASWTSSALARLDGVHVRDWMLPLFLVLVLLGLALLATALRRRPRTALTLEADTGVYLRTGDLARIARTALEGTSGITEVSCRASRRRLRVAVTTLATHDDGDHLATEVREHLDRVLAPLARAPRIVVDVHREGAR